MSECRTLVEVRELHNCFALQQPGEEAAGVRHQGWDVAGAVVEVAAVYQAEDWDSLVASAVY